MNTNLQKKDWKKPELYQLKILKTMGTEKLGVPEGSFGTTGSASVS